MLADVGVMMKALLIQNERTETSNQFALFFIPGIKS